MNQMHTNTNTELAKDYIAKRKIPQLFEVNSFKLIIKAKKLILFFF